MKRGTNKYQQKLFMQPYLKFALLKKDPSKIEKNETVMILREQFKYEADEPDKRFLIIPMCMCLRNIPYHWILLTLEYGKWGVYNSTISKVEYIWQIKAVTVPLTKVLNELGHRDFEGKMIAPTYKTYESNPKQRS